jgi:hypothetical protein
MVVRSGGDFGGSLLQPKSLSQIDDHIDFSNWPFWVKAVLIALLWPRTKKGLILSKNPVFQGFYLFRESILIKNKGVEFYLAQIGKDNQRLGD